MAEDPNTAPDRRGTIAESLGLILAIAMVMALGYAGEIGWKFLVRQTFVSASRDVLWMAPVSAALFAAVLLAPVWLAAPLLRQPVARQAAVLAGTWLVVFAILLPWTAIHRLAAAMLALGVATMAGRWCATPRRVGWLRRAGITIAIALLAGGGLLAAGRAWQSRAAYRALPAAPAGAPNVLILLLDTVRASALGMYGYPRATSPTLDSLAAGGVIFEHAVATSPWTLPSHATLFTGEYGGLLSTSFRAPLDATRETLAEHFRDAGYETVGFVGNAYYTAWDSGLGRGFLHWMDLKRSVRQVLRSGWIGQSEVAQAVLDAGGPREALRALRNGQVMVVPRPGGDAPIAGELVDALLAWEQDRSERPFFAFVNFFDAHKSYAPPEQYRTRFAPEPTPRDLYDAEIAYTDDEIGRLLGALAQRGALRNTIIVVTADHGELFDEHGISGHGNALYYQLLQIPLVVHFDGSVPAGHRLPDVVSLRDVGATVLDLAGLGAASRFPGHSLAPLWIAADSIRPARSPAISELTQDAVPRTADPLTRSQFLSLIEDDGHHGIFRHFRERRPLLFNIRTDAAELENLALSGPGLAFYDAQEERMRRLLERDSVEFFRR